jgi:glucosamine--fructose-6-phosphate aminotransferase (isomerizing)
MFLASDLPALISHTNRAVFLDDGEIARVSTTGVTYRRANGEVIDQQPQTLELDESVIARGTHEHFMLKEITEQPEAVLNTVRGMADLEAAHVELPDATLTDEQIAQIKRVVLIAMGTSLNAAAIGRTYLEQLAGLPAEVDNASEFRYRKPIIDGSTLVVAVAQSGETVDTLAAMHEATGRGAIVLTVCNTPGSQATRIADGTLYLHCGPEIAVCSTKTFLGSVAALYLLACHLGERRGFLTKERLSAALDDLARMPQAIGEALKSADAVKIVAKRYAQAEHFLFLGRGLSYPAALEGALKLKEVSYIHAEGYAAGEMKHGPIALIDERMPVVALVPRDEHYAKMLNNIEEVRARDGMVIAIATADDDLIGERAQEVIFVPEAPALLQPMVTSVPLQLLAYEIAKLRGCDIDQPRNLAKTVTVE